MATEQWFDDFVAEMLIPERSIRPGYPSIRNRHVIKMFVNSAGDKALVLDIRDAISSSKASGVVQLRSLDLRPHFKMPGWYRGFTCLLDDLCLSWDVDIGIWDDGGRPLITFPRHG